MRFYKLTATEGGPLPENEWLKIGVIIRVPRSNSQKPSTLWNAETLSWVRPIWTEVDDPRRDAS